MNRDSYMSPSTVSSPAQSTRAAAFTRAAQPKPWSISDILIGVWVLGMIAVPIVLWIVGEAALPWIISLTVLILSTAMSLVLYRAWGLAKTFETLVIILPLAWLLEFIGSATGFPFGVYDYTARFQPQIGHVPLIIPFAWLMMLPPAWAVAHLIVPRNRVGFLLVAAGAFTAWDLFLDPQMVAWGMWQWAVEGGYFGVPWQNFAGWFLGALLLTAAVRPLPIPAERAKLGRFFRQAGLHHANVNRPLLVYGVTWFLQSIGLWVFWSMPGPALVGAIVMGTFLWLAVWRSVSR